MADNGFKFKQDVNWTEVTSEPDLAGIVVVVVVSNKLHKSIISGTTARHLQHLYHSAAWCSNLKYKIETKDVTSEHVKKWLEETDRREKRKKDIQREEHLISVYLDVKNKEYI